MATDQEVLHMISEIAGDHFCFDMECIEAFRPGEFTKREADMWNKLSLIYRLSHGQDQTSTCYKHHDSWRAEADIQLCEDFAK